MDGNHGGCVMQAYLAGPLFSTAEREWQQKTRDELNRRFAAAGLDVSVLWPGDLIDEDEVTALGVDAIAEIFKRCKEALAASDICLAWLDGTQVDDGTAWEVGYFYALHGPGRIFGLRTDFRQGGDTRFSRVNAMLEASCRVIAHDFDELFEAVRTSL